MGPRRSIWASTATSRRIPTILARRLLLRTSIFGTVLLSAGSITFRLDVGRSPLAMWVACRTAHFLSRRPANPCWRPDYPALSAYARQVLQHRCLLEHRSHGLRTRRRCAKYNYRSRVYQSRLFYVQGLRVTRRDQVANPVRILQHA